MYVYFYIYTFSLYNRNVKRKYYSFFSTLNFDLEIIYLFIKKHTPHHTALSMY